MAKKGAASSSSKTKTGGNKANNTASKTKKKAPAQPTVYVCPYTHQNVYIGKATLKDLKAKSTYANTSKKRLWTLPSPQVRNDLYVEAAQALAQVEQALLPSFGGRSWEVTCKLTEPHWSGQVLFRAWKGQMELAALPHLIDKIPTPPTWPGRRTQPDEYEEDEAEDEKKLQQREVSSLSSVAWDLKDNYPVPLVTLKWQSPERKIFNSRKAAWEHATVMAAREVEINKCLLGVGASGKLLKPFIPSAPTALKVGKLRFERDGLWVVGQELAWQEPRPEQLLIEEAEEEARKSTMVPKTGLALYLTRNRDEYRETHDECTTFKQAETELRKLWKTLPRAEQKAWNRQARGDEEEESESEQEEELAEAVEEEVAEPEPEPEPEPVKLSMTPAAFYVKSRRHAYREERKAQKWSISLGECDIHLRQVWKTLERSVKLEWEQKLIEHETKKAEEKAQAEREAREAEEGKAREEAGKEAAETSSYVKTSESGSLVSNLVFASVDSKQDPNEVSNTVGMVTSHNAAEDLRSNQQIPMDETTNHSTNEKEWKTEKPLECEVATSVENKSESAADANQTKISESSSTGVEEKECTNKEEKAEDQMDYDPSPVVQTKVMAIAYPNEVGNTFRVIDHEEEKKEEEGALKVLQIKSSKDATEIVAAPCVSNNKDQCTENEKGPSSPVHVSSMEPTEKKLKSAPRKPSSKNQPVVPSKQVTERWCMNQKQIDLCFAACMEHYDTVMRTVKARDLHRELQDGFDVFRERGHGRYDMELPAFDDPKTFGFLTDLKTAPWMPVVKAILGDDAILIHKGCFLSMPGSAPQEYHQDGVHLTTQTQRSCHAVNVFVPLVDLNNRNGPTEFCLGSHVLGLEGYDRDFVETPKPKAGTPVLFDYRLGHRGLGNNSSRSCRPIVYCTYARASEGKEFRDSVNFSRKRYHKIGELSAKPMSREERRNKRKRSAVEKEEEQLQRAIEESSSAPKATNGSSEGDISDGSNKAIPAAEDRSDSESKVTSPHSHEQDPKTIGATAANDGHDAESTLTRTLTRTDDSFPKELS